MRALVIIPTYNEAENIVALIGEVLKNPVDILVVDDNSQDGTAGLVKKLIEQNPKRIALIERAGKLGLGTAYIKGFEYGLAHGYEALIEMDADFSHDPTRLPAMIATLADHDVVIGSRYTEGGGTVNWGLMRQLISRGGGWYARTILGMRIKDMTGGYNGWRSSIIAQIGPESIQSEGYAFQIELKYRAHLLGASIKEIPIVFHDRRAGQSKMSTKIMIEAMIRVWKLRFTFY
jgi:dolichol-phosphate mannosyltransferase